MADILKKVEALANAGKFDEAERVIKAAKVAPVVRTGVLATLALKRGEQQEAEVLFLRALELDPKNVLAAANYASLLINQKKQKKALPYAELAHKAMPKHEPFALFLAACLADSDRAGEGAATLAPFAQAEKPSLAVLTSYASLLRADLQSQAAFEVMRRACQLYPDSPEAQRNFADVHGELDQSKAADAFRAALEGKPESLALQWNSSFVELRLRNFERGWQMYEAGLTDAVGRIGRPLPAQVKLFPCITELDQLDPAKWTLFSSEQGLGDQVLFLGCLEEALARFPKANLVCEERMLSLLGRSFPQIEVCSYGYAFSLSRQGHRINGVFPIGSLMKHFRQTTASFEAHRRTYLVPDAAKVSKMRETLQGKIPGKTLVGISWRGGFWDRQIRTKSFDFELFGRLMKDRRYQFISLQYGDVAEERAMAKARGWPVTFIDGADFKKDLDTWLAIACACERIVSVSTALVHFVGAAGGRVDLLIGDYQAPFIWGLEEGMSLPYAGVNIVRKSKEETVEAFFDRVGEDVL